MDWNWIVVRPALFLASWSQTIRVLAGENSLASRSTIIDAIAGGDARSLEFFAHRLKSLVGAYCHEAARELAYALCLMGRDGNPEDAAETPQARQCRTSLINKQTANS